MALKFEVGKSYVVVGAGCRAIATVKKRTDKTITLTIFNGYLGVNSVVRIAKHMETFDGEESLYDIKYLNHRVAIFAFKTADFKRQN